MDLLIAEPVLVLATPDSCSAAMPTLGQPLRATHRLARRRVRVRTGRRSGQRGRCCRTQPPQPLCRRPLRTLVVIVLRAGRRRPQHRRHHHRHCSDARLVDVLPLVSATDVAEMIVPVLVDVRMLVAATAGA